MAGHDFIAFVATRCSFPFCRQVDAVRDFYRVIGLDEVPGADDQRPTVFVLGEATLSLSPVDEDRQGVKPDYCIKTPAYGEILTRLRHIPKGWSVPCRCVAARHVRPATSWLSGLKALDEFPTTALRAREAVRQGFQPDGRLRKPARRSPVSAVRSTSWRKRWAWTSSTLRQAPDRPGRQVN